MALFGLGGGAGDIIIKVGADVSQAVSELGKVRGGLEDTRSTGERFRSGLQSAAVPAAAALTAVAAAGMAAAKAAAEDAQSRSLLDEQIRRSTDANQAAIDSTETWIDALSKSTATADDELRPALGNLVRATGDVTEAQDLLNTALDLSAATGSSLESTSKALAKAHEGSYGALKKLVPSLDDAAIKSGDWAKIQEQLNAEVGGAAAKNAETTAGQYKNLQIQMGELQETIGAALLPAFTGLVGIMLPAVALAQEHSHVIVALGGAVAAVAGTILTLNAAMWAWTAATKAWTVATKVAGAAQKAFAAVTWLVNAAMAANPIVLVIAAVIALGVALVIAYKKSETFRNIVNSAFDAVVGAAKSLWKAMDPFMEALKRVWELARQMAGIVSDAFGQIVDAISRVADAIGDLIGWIGRIHWPSKPSWLPLTAGGFAAPTLAPAGAGTFSSPGGMVVNVTVTGAVDPESTARQIRTILERYDRRRGRRPLGGETDPGGLTG